MEARAALLTVCAATALCAAGCGGSNDDRQSTDTRPAPSAAALDPCSLLSRGEVAAHAGVDKAEQVRARGLSIKDDRVVECRLSTVSGDTLNVGYVGARPGALRALMDPVPDKPVKLPSGRALGQPVERLRGVGDEAYIGKEQFLYYVAARKGRAQLLLTMAEQPDGPKRRDDAIALARAAVKRLPERVALGQREVPPACRALRDATVASAIGKVIVARGSRTARSLVCDYAGAGGTRLRSSVEQLTPSNIDELVRSSEKDEFVKPIEGFAGAKVFYADDPPNYSAYVDRRWLIDLDLTPGVGEPDYRRHKFVSRTVGDRLLRALIKQARALG